MLCRASNDTSRNNRHERSEGVVRRLEAVLEEDAQTIMAITMMMTMMRTVTTRERGRVEVAAEVEEEVQLPRSLERLQRLEGEGVQQEGEEQRGVTLTTMMTNLVSLNIVQPKKLPLTKVNLSSASSEAVKTLRWRCRR